MIALYINLGVIIFITLLLLIPINISISYEEILTVRYRYFFLSSQITPQKEKPKVQDEKKPEEKPEPKAEKKKSSIKRLIEENGIRGFLSLVKQITGNMLGSLKKITSHIIINNIELNLAIVGEDAASIAIQYGYACSAVYPAFNTIILVVQKCKKYNINVVPAFTAEKTEFNFKIDFSLKLLFLVGISISLAFKVLKIIIKNKMSQKYSKQKQS